MSLDKAFKIKQGLTETLTELTREFEYRKEILLKRIEEQNNIIDNYNNMEEKEADGSNLVEFRVSKSATKSQVRELIEFTIRSIEKGELNYVLDYAQNYSYWYSPRFGVGRSRVIELNRGENNAVEQVRIKFKKELYGNGYATDEEKFEILSYLKNLLTQY